MVQNQTHQLIVHAVALSVLVFVALTLATKFGLIHCSQVPYWCDGYRSVISTFYGRTYPSIIILHGDTGMGDPQLLYRIIEDSCQLFVDIDRVDAVSLGNLDSYDVVIVERARTLAPEHMDTLWEFVAKGGKILLIGDVGVDVETPEEYVTVEDTNTAESKILNTWDRKDEFGRHILFGTRFLGLRYIGNYCSGDDCSVSGTISFKQDILTKGLPSRVPFPQNFAIVEDLRSSSLGPHTTVATIEGVAPIQGAKPPYPAILRTGYRMVYLAFPPEELWKMVDNQLDKGNVPEYASVLGIIRNICNWASG